MSRRLILPDLSFLLLISTLFFYTCQPPLPANIDSLFANWFINPNTADKQVLSSYNLSAETLDSLALSIRQKKISEGKHSCNLTDEDGMQYIMGFATPEHIIADSLYGLIVYLHGGIGTTRNDKGEHAYEMFRFIADTMDLFLASPSGNREAPWWSVKGLNRILKTVRYMTLHFPIDPDRIVLAGVSDGATGCYAAANTINGPFAGFIAVSGFGGMLPRLGMELIPSNIRQRPIYNINAGKDHIYPMNIVEQFLTWLTESGVSVKQKFYPDEAHGFDYRVKETETLIQLLNTWQKQKRTAISWTIVNNVPNLTDNLLRWETCSNDDDKHIIAYIQKETLNVRMKGICSFSMVTDNKIADKLFLVFPDGNKKQIPAGQPDTRLYLDLLQHYCRPVITDKKIYRVESK